MIKLESDVGAAKNDSIATDGHRVHQASDPDDNNRAIRSLSDDIGRDKLEAAGALPTVAPPMLSPRESAPSGVDWFVMKRRCSKRR